MDDENKTTNPFEEAESNSDLQEENTSEYVDFGTPLSSDEQENNYYNDVNYNDNSSYEGYNNMESDYNNNQMSYNEQDTFFNQPEAPKNNSIAKKIPIIFFIIVLIVLLIFLLKNLLGTEEPTTDLNNNSSAEVNDEESVINKKYVVDSTKLANGNILIDIYNKNTLSVDAEVILEYYDNNGDTINNETINIKNIPAKSHYFEVVSVKQELKEMEYSLKTKLTKNKFKEYYKDKIEITNKTEEEENLLVEVKNDSYFVVDVIEVYVIYYDEEDNIIGFDNSTVKKLAVDKTSEIKMNYPKDKEYKYVSFSKYDVGINTAYSYKND